MSAASYSVDCSVGQINNHTYTWQLIYTTPQGSTLILDSGSFGVTASLFGGMGIIIAILIVAVMGMAFVFVNPAVAVIAAVIGMILSGLFSLITLNTTGLGFLIVFAAVAVYAMTRR